jgi:hypothetical protein
MKSLTTMGKTVAVAVFVLGAFASSRGAAAQASDPEHAAQHPATQHQAAAQQPGALSATLITSAVKVEKIDKAKGLISLKSPDGKVFDVKAGPNINMDRLHVGDIVTASYYQEVAVSIDKASTGAPKMTSKAVQRGGVAAMQSTVTSHIVAVDPSKETVTIRGPMGEHTLKVEDPALQARLKQIKPGENFDVTYTQAVAVSIEQRPRKK